MSTTEEPGSAKALIFMTARNCAGYVPRSLASLAKQSLKNIHVLFVDDCSDDDTAAVAAGQLEELFSSRYTFVGNRTRGSKARSAWEHLRPLAGRAEFIAVLDADDQLIDPTILEKMAGCYQQGRDVVWTNYVTDRGMVGGNGPLDPLLPPRQQGWKTSHFFSFRSLLLESVPESYFKTNDGEWLPAACDIALALPMVDQTRRYEYIPVAAYGYTSSNPQSHHNLDAQSIGLNSTVQRKYAREVFMKPPLPLIRPVVAPQQPAPALKAEPQAPGTPLVPLRNQTWQDLAGSVLVNECPSLLDAAAFTGQSQLTPMEAWALRGLIKQSPSPANILHIGATRSALVLAALASALGGQVISLCASASEARELAARVEAGGLGARIALIETPPVQAVFEDFSGPFPDTRILGDEAKFDLVVVDLPSSLPQGTALVALSMLVNWLSPEGFAFCLLGQTRSLESLAAQRWQAISSGLTFCPDAIGGSGLLVKAGG